MSIERFNQLRQEFSDFDRNDNPTMPKPISNTYKPLTKVLCSLNTNLHWIIPVSKTKNKLYDLTTSDFLDTNQYDDNLSFEAIGLYQTLTEENDCYKEYRNKTASIDDNYKTFIYNSYELTIPFNSSMIDSIYSRKVNTNLLSVIDNNVDDDDNNTYVVDDETNTIASKKYFFEMFTNKLKVTDNNSDAINITSIIVLPLLKDIHFFNYSKIDLPFTNVLQKFIFLFSFLTFLFSSQMYFLLMNASHLQFDLSRQYHASMHKLHHLLLL
jgi:hypothetical protein